jgi:hypothetical protein
MSEIVENRYGDILVRDNDEKDQIAKEIADALFAIAKPHVRALAEPGDDPDADLDREEFGLVSVKWIRHLHRRKYPDLYLRMNGAISAALQLPQHQLLVTHVELDDDWSQYDHLRTAIKKNIWHNGLDKTVMAVHLPWIEVDWDTFYGTPVSELRSRRDALTGEVHRIMMFEAQGRNI